MRVSSAVWRHVFTRDRGRCQYCGVDLLRSFSAYWSATVDHLVAVSARGNDKPKNLKLACPACNAMLSRGAKLKTFAERKAFIKSRQAEELGGYREWLGELRRGPP